MNKNKDEEIIIKARIDNLIQNIQKSIAHIKDTNYYNKFSNKAIEEGIACFKYIRQELKKLENTRASKSNAALWEIEEEEKNNEKR